MSKRSALVRSRSERLLDLVLSPDAELVSAGVSEMEASSAGELIRAIHDPAAGCNDALDAGIEIIGEQQDKCATGDHLFGEAEPTALCSFNFEIFDTCVARAVIVERPPERCCVELFGNADIEDPNFDVVDGVVAKCGVVFSHPPIMATDADKTAAPRGAGLVSSGSAGKTECMKASREHVLRYRVHAQQLDRDSSSDAAILDLGVQDTGPDGGAWALKIRGATTDNTVIAWTLRGAPHLYRRSEVSQVASATTPMSSADAAKRIFDAAKPLKAAGIDIIDALDAIAAEMRDIVHEPTVKGEMSTQLTDRMSEPYRRFCRPCHTIHLYEQPFRIAALRAGLEIQPQTSPPVLQRIKGWKGSASSAPPHLHPIRAYLHLLGPATPKQVAAYMDSPVKDVVAHWPDDVVDVDGASILASDADALATPADVSRVVRLLGPFDLFLQARDREVVIPDGSHRKDVWRTLGRPGAILIGHEIAGTWRPKTSGKRLTLAIDRWTDVPEDDLVGQAELLAAHRSVSFDGFVSVGNAPER